MDGTGSSNVADDDNSSPPELEAPVQHDQANGHTAEPDEHDQANSPTGEPDEHDHLYKCLGEVIRDRRKVLALSQSELATSAGIDRAFLSNLEHGQRKPSFGIVARIARGLKLKYSRLVAQCEKCEAQRAKSA